MRSNLEIVNFGKQKEQFTLRGVHTTPESV